MEMDKHGLGVGDYNRVVGKGPGSRPQIPKESSMDRGPYFDKVSWGHWGQCWAPPLCLPRGEPCAPEPGAGAGGLGAAWLICSFYLPDTLY